VHGEKRAKAQGEGAPGSERPDFGEDLNANSKGGMGGMGPGQTGWGHGNDVPHFDKEGHFRTHEQYEKRRRRRMEEEGLPTGPITGPFGQFFLVSAIVAVGITIPSLIFGKLSGKSNKDNK